MSETTRKEDLTDTLDQLKTINRELESAIDEKNYDEIEVLIARRGPVVSKLIVLHEKFPVPPDDVSAILAHEAQLKSRLDEMQSQLGSELGHSRKAAHAQRMYARHAPTDSLKKRG